MRPLGVTGPLPFLALLGLASLAGGCGHPASERECEEIVERVARLELEQAHANSETVQSEVQIAKDSFKKDMGKKCVGRRVTTEAMNCVRSAKSSDQIEKECFR